MSIATPIQTDVEHPPDLTQPRSARGTPTWEIAHLFPEQGEWSEEEYFNLDTNHLIEYVDGCLEFLPMPSLAHQFISRFLFLLLDQFVASRSLGNVLYSPARVRIRHGKHREPDVLFLAKGRKVEKQFAHGADLVIEIVSEGEENRERDLTEKRADYATARVPEYWIVDPEEETIHVLVLDGVQYRVHGEFKPGETATSVLLDGFSVDVTACFAAASDQ
jgi:Uma2 family endonuclease